MAPKVEGDNLDIPEGLVLDLLWLLAAILIKQVGVQITMAMAMSMAMSMACARPRCVAERRGRCFRNRRKDILISW
jgi:hypothetical protein